MKVLHVINTLSAGGAELQLLTLCRSLRREDLDVLVACLKEHVKGSQSLRSDFEAAGVPVFTLDGERSFGPLCLVKLSRLVGKERPDILHTHLPRADFAGVVAHRLYPSIRFRSTVHAMYSESWSGRWALGVFDLVWRHADAVVAISDAVKQWLVKRKLPERKIQVIHYGIETGRFLTFKDDLRRDWRLNGQPVVASIGRLEPGKGHDTLITCMPILLRQVPDARLFIAGHDPTGYAVHLEQLIEKLGLRDRVKLIGFQKDISSFLHTANAVGFLSRSEGFGQVAVEAMAAGKPLVASRIPPLTEIVVDGKTGLLVHPDDTRGCAEALAWLLSHPADSAQMGQEGQNRVRAFFSAEQMTQRTVSLYEQLLSSRL